MKINNGNSSNSDSLKASQNNKIAAKKSRIMRENLSEKKIDKMIKDSFPASDPPSTY